MNGNPDLERSWATLIRNIKIDKIYIEVMRKPLFTSKKSAQIILSPATCGG